MRVAYNKLVRDQMPEIIAAAGRQPVTRVLDQAGYRRSGLPDAGAGTVPGSAFSQDGGPAQVGARGYRGKQQVVR